MGTDLDLLPFVDFGDGNLEESDKEEEDEEEDGDLRRFLDRRCTYLSRSLIRSWDSSGKSKWD